MTNRIKPLRGQLNVMGILNVTPDSFSDGGEFVSLDQALKQAEQIFHAGAAVIDIGGESTRPGAQEVSVQQELDRVFPVLVAIKERFEIAVSIDTSKAEVMSAAIAAGADMINDVRALQEEGALQACAASDVEVCLMHMQGQPRTMQENPFYHDVVNDVTDFFQQRLLACEQAGISSERVWLDPGFGFGKTLEHNLTLLRQQERFLSLGLPLLIGMSRKRMIGSILGDKPVEQRLQGSVAAAVIAAMKGAALLRVHDVAETVDAIKIVQAVLTEE